MRLAASCLAVLVLGFVALVDCTGADPALVTVEGPSDEAGADVVALDATPSADSGGRSPMSEVGVGAFHGCALGVDGDVWCWGDNGAGQRGLGTVGNGPSSAMRVPGLPKITQFSVGLAHTCAVGTDETVWCWGDNEDGEVSGDPAADPLCGAVKCAAAPRKVEGLAARQVMALAQSTCAVTAAGGVSCWGGNDDGLLGAAQPIGTASSTPVPVTGLASGVFQIGAQPWPGRAICALTSTQHILCWGANGSGNLGHPTGTSPDVSGGPDPGSPIYAATPSEVTVPGATAEVYGDSTSCAVLVDGALFCWGNDGCGQLAGAAPDAGASTSTPARLSVTSVRRVRMGGATCALRVNGDVLCWGDDSDRIVGGTSTSSCTTLTGVTGVGTPVPQPKTGFSATAIAVGLSAAAMVDRDGNVLAWGNNSTGQLGHPAGDLGDGADFMNPVPQFVAGLGPRSP